MKRFGSSCAILAASLVLSGCSCHHLEEINPQQVSNKTWMLTTMNGAAASGPLVSMVLVPATNQDGRIVGQAQCNRYFGTYQVADDALSFSPMGGGKMACPAPFMTKEAEYLAAFPKVNNIVINGNHLALTNKDETVYLTYAAQTQSVNGRVFTSFGDFPAGSELVLILQDKNAANELVGIVGIEEIAIDSQADVVNYSIAYAPETIDPKGDYQLIAEVFLGGELIYVADINPSVNLKSAPVQMKVEAP